MDYRLKWDPDEYDGLDLIVVDPDQVWLPKLMIFNAVASDHANIVDKDEGQILLESTGQVNLGLQILQSTQCALRIEYFPYDQQVCPFFFGFQNLPDSIARLEVTGTAIYSYNTTTQWDILELTGNVSSGFIPDMTSKNKFDNVSVATFCLFLKRHPNYYIGTLIIPSTCLCLLAFMTFLAPPDCGERVSVGVSMVLGLTVFQLLMSDLLPISNESSILSDYLSTNFIFVVLTVPLSLGNMNLAYGDRTRDLPRWKWYRRLFLEYLPAVLFTPSLSQRLSNIRRTNKVTPQQQQLQLEDLEQTKVNGKTDEEKTKVKGPDVTEKIDDYDHQEVSYVT
ncbi:Neuronal acetylcholine receptor subunit alpha-3 [Holothuria leucospilota]|uniref:Neuronal acetylcholine receptor subunit alpha-3 n=1 Tax=Holothuria leucospilota TaxID=206669 RepID=A0A9Q1H4A9_HOLLE|nr:Neuronal acetylcholine receptor subunit alpha-3 [Holothuria leucospilota]